MAFLWLLSCFTLIGIPFGVGIPAGEPELSIKPRIINGMDAQPGSWPWHVAIQSKEGEIYCGGTLLNRFWVMTAANCNITTSEWAITGLFDRKLPLDKNQVLKIDKTFVHPMWDSDTGFGDIALLKLSSPARMQDALTPAVLPSFAEVIPAGTRCIIMGWGLTHTRSITGPWRLQQASVIVMPNAECKRYWGSVFSSTMICAGAKLISNYKGDSGSPLVCPKDRFWKVVGIASQVQIYNLGRAPVVFTHVSPFSPWVGDIQAQN